VPYPALRTDEAIVAVQALAGGWIPAKSKSLGLPKQHLDYGHKSLRTMASFGLAAKSKRYKISFRYRFIRGISITRQETPL
jgi:hypothetical protein